LQGAAKASPGCLVKSLGQRRRRSRRRRCRASRAASAFASSLTSTSGRTTTGRRRRLAIAQALPVHGNAEKPGGTVSFHLRGDFLEMSPRSLLAVVHAHHDLRRYRPGRASASVIGGKGGEEALPVMSLVGQEPDFAALARRKRSRKLQGGRRIPNIPAPRGLGKNGKRPPEAP
jgi:hypothetical protein